MSSRRLTPSTPRAAAQIIPASSASTTSPPTCTSTLATARARSSGPRPSCAPSFFSSLLKLTYATEGWAPRRDHRATHWEGSLGSISCHSPRRARSRRSSQSSGSRRHPSDWHACRFQPLVDADATVDVWPDGHADAPIARTCCVFNTGASTARSCVVAHPYGWWTVPGGLLQSVWAQRRRVRSAREDAV
jgi:hypothetical protein